MRIEPSRSVNGLNSWSGDRRLSGTTEVRALPLWDRRNSAAGKRKQGRFSEARESSLSGMRLLDGGIGAILIGLCSDKLETLKHSSHRIAPMTPGDGRSGDRD